MYLLNYLPNNIFNTKKLNESNSYILKCLINYLEKNSVMNIFKVFISIIL